MQNMWNLQNDVSGEACFSKKKSLYNCPKQRFATVNLSQKDSPWSRDSDSLVKKNSRCSN